MPILGDYNVLEVSKHVDFGVYLFDENKNEILLPTKFVPEGIRPGDSLEVFIYRDSEDRIIATTQEALAKVNTFAFLRVVDNTKVGSFLNWGLDKDLLVPHREQKVDMEPGRSYWVYVYLDKESDRIVASAKLDKFLDNMPPEYALNDEVEAKITQRTDLGYKCIVNNKHWGMLFENEVFSVLNIGEEHKAYVKQLRDDDKIDLTLQPGGYDKIDELSLKILEYLKANNGTMLYTDKSDTNDIYNLFGMSKKNFKKSLGLLYKKRLINLNKNSTELI